MGTLLDYGPNFVDWAIATPYEDGSPYRDGSPHISEDIATDENGDGYVLDRSYVNSSSDMFPGMYVQKVGRTTGWTHGEISNIYFNHIYIESPTGETISNPGDSGSLWVDEQGRPVGLHYASYSEPEAQAEFFINDSDLSNGIMDEVDISFQRNNLVVPPKHRTVGHISGDEEVTIFGAVDNPGASDNFRCFFRWRKLGEDFDWHETDSQSFTDEDMPEDNPLVISHNLSTEDGLEDGDEIEFIFVVDWDYLGENYGRRYPSIHDYEEDPTFQEAEIEKEVTEEPSVVTNQATDITESQATLNCTVESIGSYDILDLVFLVDEEVVKTIEATSSGTYSHTESGLTSDTNYTYSTELRDGSTLIDSGGEQSFTTLAEDEEVTTYDLTISSQAGGSVINPGEGNYNYDDNTTVTIEAEPNEGYEFVEWLGDNATIDNTQESSTTINVTGNYSIEASFKEIEDDTEPIEGTVKFWTGTKWKTTVKVKIEGQWTEVVPKIFPGDETWF